MRIMAMLTPSRFAIALGVLLAVSVPENAHAYLDPGTGSVILQVVAAGVLGALFTFKNYLRAAKGAVLRLLGRNNSVAE
jgi:hypothetical protein